MRRTICLTSLTLLVSLCHGFVPSLSYQGGMISSRKPVRPLSSIQLPRDADLTVIKQDDADMEMKMMSQAATAVGDAASVDIKAKKAKGPAPVVVLEDDILESTTEHKVIVGAHYAASALSLAQIASDLNIHNLQEGGLVAGVIAFSVIFSDLFSGVFHWSVDNYGDGNTPVMGSIIAAFQGHHDAPWTITHRPFANNVHKICKITTPAIIALMIAHPAHLLALFATLFFNLQVLSQEFHKLSHMSKPPAWAVTLQDMGLIISRKEHGQHHSSPFESNYCILTGTCNPFLDQSGIFRVLERVVYQTTGVEPNCWKLGPDVKAASLATTSRD